MLRRISKYNLLQRPRVTTALTLIVITVSGVLLFSTAWVAIFLAIPMLPAIKEWANLAGFNRPKSINLMFLITLIGGLNWIWFIHYNQLSPLLILLLITLWWIITGLRITRINSIQLIQYASPITASIGILILLTTWGSLIWLHAQPNGPWLLLFLFTQIWIADTAAYLAGRYYGSTKLAPILSPNKTTAGLYAALIATIFWATMLALFFSNNLSLTLALITLCLFTTAISVIGDLYESLLKRQRGIKDSGNLLPGHGGILDRIDSLTAAAPIFTLGLKILGII